MDKFKTVDEFLASLDDTKRPQVLKVRGYILEVGPDLREHIKWNAPSYVRDGEDRITFNLFNKEGLVKLVFHMGALRKEDRKAPPVLVSQSDIIEWVSDIRGYVTFRDMQDVSDKEAALKDLVIKWLALPAS